MSMPLMKATQYQLQDDTLMKGGPGIIGVTSDVALKCASPTALFACGDSAGK